MKGMRYLMVLRTRPNLTTSAEYSSTRGEGKTFGPETFGAFVECDLEFDFLG